MPNPVNKPETTASAAWIDVGTIVETADGLARVMSRPNRAGACRVRFADGTDANLDTTVETFTVVPSPTGVLQYLAAEHEEWSTDRDRLERDRADRKAFDESDEAAIELLRRFAEAVGLMQPGDGERSGPICTICLATGWSFADLTAPEWCTSCRGTGRNPAPALESA